MSGVFINYRSDDDDFAAPLIDERLRAEFGDEQVFRDGRSLHAGIHFPTELWGRLLSSTVLLVLIGERWLSLTDNAGLRRIDDPDDFVRKEIRESFKNGLAVIPVLLKKAGLPRAEELPSDISGLTKQQFVRLRTREADIDLDHLVKELHRLIPAEKLPMRAGTGTEPATIFRHGGSQFNGPVTFRGDNVSGDKIVRGGKP